MAFDAKRFWEEQDRQLSEKEFPPPGQDPSVNHEPSFLQQEKRNEERFFDSSNREKGLFQ